MCWYTQPGERKGWGPARSTATVLGSWCRLYRRPISYTQLLHSCPCPSRSSWPHWEKESSLKHSNREMAPQLAFQDHFYFAVGCDKLVTPPVDLQWGNKTHPIQTPMLYGGTLSPHKANMLYFPPSCCRLWASYGQEPSPWSLSPLYFQHLTAYPVIRMTIHFFLFKQGNCRVKRGC